ncbi:hydrolase [Actinoplanes italicus]|uniref:HAD superfamily hydrolase (TIGR01509 family)/HAD superfamily hydrolase (TIGR01549 family) n=1 Tax=Actinoplanes italicus TaxID=113567 RepID=A0A2T0KH69_9ACTN|nr:HAD family hydrolase [Actinoplanes italicus]PRX22794.1 HAD superfamily hydrolase (TIGR01509 family)/HAD superfamily hydrolase (TIGR01549 family) [Actinoplanes italicus]GIE28316.1 hydrolase [Actinoplanes italicus]
MVIDDVLAPINGVVFDFHSTLVDGGDPARWIRDALRRLDDAGVTVPGLSDATFTSLREHLNHIWTHAHGIDPASERDLDPARHRDVFARSVALLPGIDPALTDALYAVMRDQWEAYDDTLPVLRELKSRGVKIVVLSNIGMDIRDCLDRAGVGDLLDGVVLSYEVGLTKPDPAIFQHVIKLLDLPGSQVLMVGDSPRDDVGGAALGIRTLILPRTQGPVHGLSAVLRLVGDRPATSVVEG